VRNHTRGPRPGSARLRLSRGQADLLDRLVGQPEPTTVAALASATGLHENTVREHLDALVAKGLAHRTSAPPQGRGRPAALFSAGTDSASPSAREYAGLASALAGQLSRVSDDPVADGLAAGRDWGRDLAADDVPAAGGNQAARRQVVALLSDLGFGPEENARATSARLTRCPLLEAAHRHPDIVCAVHLGLVRGAMEKYGATAAAVERTDLVPFAEAGGCRLLLQTPPG
jgi:predicted ArsR family transcriptional regulator